MLKYLRRIFLAAFAAIFLFNIYSFAAEEDGFGPAERIESQYFTILYAPQLNPEELNRELDTRTADAIISGKSYQNDLGGSIDSIFTQVCDILDMQLYSYHGTIKICRDFKQASGIYDNFFRRELTAKSHSYYVNDLNTIYIPADHFKREVLGHEIGHAVISHYFVVSPSVKIQEVLATFVEYQLRKIYK